MATTLKTTFLLKRGTFENWTSKNPVLQKGEPGFVEDKNILKIGDGVTAFNDLPSIVPDWALEGEKPKYTANEIEGLADFISGEIDDTDTQYQIVKVDDNNYKLQSKALGGTWTDVADSAIVIPTYDDSDLADKVANIESSLGIGEGGSTGGEGGGSTDPSDPDAPKTIPEKIEAAVEDSKQYTDDQLKTVAITKKSTANEGFIATYQLMIGETAAGEVDIPKDYLVKSGDIKVVTAVGDPYTDAVVGDKYIDFVVNTTDNTGNESHIYIPLKDIGGDAYSAGRGIDISDTNQISVKIAENSNGLVHTDTGITMELASAEKAGSMSADSFKALQDLKENMSLLEPSEINGNIKINGEEVTIYELPDDVVKLSDTFIFDGGEA